MSADVIPECCGEPILGRDPRPAFRIAPREIIFSIQQQFTQKELALRELGQNSRDAEATAIRVDYRYEEGCLILEFGDDGCGMSEEVIRRHYLRLFDSSKEGQAGKVGRWSLGRLSLFCYEPERVEVYTLAPGSPGYRVVVEADFSGKLYRLDREAAERVIGHPHGTLVRMRVEVESAEGFAELVGKANECIDRELAWIGPRVDVTTVELTDGGLKYGSRSVNQPLAVPGRYNTRLTVQLASGAGQVDCALGLSSQEEKSLAPITLCCGRIPIERPAGLPWTGGEEFALRGMHVILDSFAFQTNIGRNVVYRDTPMLGEFLPKFFEQVVLGRFARTMARLYAQPAARLADGEEALRLLMADICIMADLHGFAIPEEVLAAPFIQSYVSFRPYSLAELDRAEGEIYFTGEKPGVLSMRSADEARQVVCLCVGDLPWEFRKFLENRYAGRLKEKESRLVVVDEDAEELRELGARLRRRLGRVNPGVNGFGGGPGGGPELPANVEIAVGRLVRFDGVADRETPTLYVKSPARIFLNYEHPHIVNLAALIDGDDERHADLAAHFLMREILFDPGLDLAVAQRERLLTRDLNQRFFLGLEGDEEAGLLVEEMLALLADEKRVLHL